MNLDEIRAKLDALGPEARAVVVQSALNATKGMRWVPNPGPQTEAYRSEADELFYGGSAGGGKLLDNNTILPVPLQTHRSGFKKHGDLLVGDFIYSPSGNPVRVDAVFDIEENPDAYELEFDTGETIIADADHLWSTWTEHDRYRLLSSSEDWRARRKTNRPSRAVANSQKPWVSKSISAINAAREHEIKLPSAGIRTTQEIAETLYTKRGAINHSVEVTNPIQGDDLDLPIDPYLLGLWLGDGFSRAPKIIMMESDWEFIDKHLPEPDKIEVQAELRKNTVLTKSFFFMRPHLRRLGIFGPHMKDIPILYQRASFAQRLALFQGMMDTDGTCAKNCKCELGFSNEKLARSALHLAASLGIKASLHCKEMLNPNHNDHWRFCFATDLPVFRLPRKLERQQGSVRRATTKRRYIIAARKVAPVPMRCIKVANSDGLYLVGKSFITTHNTDLIVGLSLTSHQRSLVLRRTNKEAGKLVERFAEVIGNRDGWNGQDDTWRLPDGRIIDIGGCQYEEDKQKYKGTPHDGIFLDEISDFSESQYEFITIWNRSATPGQRCRVVAAGNPPTRPEGLWVLKRWDAWLDPKHPNPAKPGELRWYMRNEEGDEVEVKGAGPHLLSGKPITARSRTFIRARLEDNPDLVKTDYDAILARLPKELRDAYRDGKFDAGLKDEPWQLIPSEWVKEAQARWTSSPPPGVMQSAIGVDVARGGDDETVLAIRYNGWFAPLIGVPGKKTPLGSDVAGLVISHRRGDPAIIMDMGGGYGGAPFEHLKANGIPVVPYVGAKASNQRTLDKQLPFTNTRSAAYWRFREALDPSQPGGSQIALPDDSRLFADLTAPTWSPITGRGIKVENKEDVVARLGRSCDRADAVVMSWFSGVKGSTHQRLTHNLDIRGGKQPQVILGYASRKQK